MYHSSAFETISARSDYIKIINHGGSTLANLNDTMQTKQHAMKKRTHVQIETRFTLWWKEENVQNLKFFLFNMLDLYSIHLYF